MNAETFELAFNGRILQRGFWLYVWEITPPIGPKLYYVGRTGDSASANAQSPFNRMGQHLGFVKNSNMLRRHLEGRQVRPEQCQFRLIAHGPIESESPSGEPADHNERRDRVAALEKALATVMREAGYLVINEVKCRKMVGAQRFAQIRAAFSAEFPELARLSRCETELASRPNDPEAR